MVLTVDTRQWNFADVWEALARRRPSEPALIHGETVHTWKDFDRRANGVAALLLDLGLKQQDKLAQFCRNRPEYLEAMFASFKAGLVPVNTNFRYGDAELAYLWTDSDTRAVVFDAEFTETCDRLRGGLPEIRAWIRVSSNGAGRSDDGSCPPWAIPYAAAVQGGRDEPVEGPWGRSGSDLELLYTGGTTGLPKGVMWPQHDLFMMIEHQYGRTPTERADVEDYVARSDRPGPRVLPGPPLMHGTASWFSMAALSAGGSVVTLTRRSFDPVELLETVAARQVKGLCIVGDPFARPILAELDAAPGRYDLSSLRLIMSSGAMLSGESKSRLGRYAPSARVVDGLGTSESGAVGTAVGEERSGGQAGRFVVGENVRVIDEDGHDVVPGSGQPGRLAVGGHLPLGYYKDAAKTRATWLTIDGRRYVVAGDWALVGSDGTITLLGRGSGCINTAGEKVYPEEVEEVLKRADGVWDASVVGVPDEHTGEAVVALVELEGDGDFDEAALIAHTKSHLAGYKAPRRVFLVKEVARHANGKMDYRAMKDEALSRLEPS